MPLPLSSAGLHRHICSALLLEELVEKSENGEGQPRDVFEIGCVFWMVPWLFLHSLPTACYKVMFLQRFSLGRI